MLEKTVGAAFAVSLLAVLTMVIVTTVETSIAPDYPHEGQLFMAEDRHNTGVPVTLDAFEGPAPLAVHAVFQDMYRVIIVKVAVDDLRQASTELGLNAGQFAIALPGEPGMALVGYGASSPHLGCTIELFSDAFPNQANVLRRADGTVSTWFIDPCHQGLWDVLGLGAQRTTAQPGGSPLDIVPLSIRDGAFWMSEPLEQTRVYGASTETTFRMA